MVEPTTAIGFDFGMYHIGIAVGQTITGVATPKPSIQAKRGKPDWQAIEQLMQQWQPGILVVGMPYQDDGSDQPITKAARSFKEALIKRYPTCQVFEQDERYTTQLARTALIEAKGLKALNKDALDGWSAKAILEEWLLMHSD